MSMAISGLGGASTPWTVSGASSYASPTAKMSNLFSQIDTGSSGLINQDQFNQAFTNLNPPGVFKAAGADAVFSSLDPTGTGSVSQADFISGMTSLMSSLRRGSSTATFAAGSSPTDTLSSSLQSLNELGGSKDPSVNNGMGSIVNLLG